MTDKIRVLIADDHPIVRKGLRTLISNEPDMELTGEAVDGVEVVLKARALKPSIIVLDMQMPRQDSVTAIRQIKQENAAARIMLLGDLSKDDPVAAALRAGALGYMSKEASSEQLIQAIRDTHHGKSALEPSFAAKLLVQFNRPAEQSLPGDALSAREVQEILKLVARGLSNQEIAQTLIISERTVGNFMSSILSKLNVVNRTQAALYALRKGLARLDDWSTLQFK